jgi:MerR family transcriptional regulator, light-induced transcriptional regulator
MTDAREQIEHPRLARSLPEAYQLERAVVRDGRSLHRQASAEGLSGLARTIETAVIPSLVIAHAKAADNGRDLVERDNSASNDAAALAEQLVVGDTDGAADRIDTFRNQGLSLEDIYLQVLAPAAGHLRRQWMGDLCGFAEATLALWRLQQLLRQYSVEFRAEGDRQETGRRALLAPTPREKHDLGYAMFYLVLMSEFFRRDGWEAWIEPDPNAREFAAVIREQWFDVVQFLVSGDKQLDALASRIRMIRRESQNRSIGVMVYGQVFIEQPELVVLVGADHTATDARQGALQAQHLVGLTSSS